MELILWVIAVVLVVSGVVALSERRYFPAAVLIIGGLLVGPGGVSLF